MTVLHRICLYRYYSAAAYAIAETFKLREGLYLKLRQAPGFYGVIAFSTLLGFAINLIGINPIQALYYTAVLNGIVAPRLLVMIMLIGNNRSIMKSKVNRRVSNTMGWITTIAMRHRRHGENHRIQRIGWLRSAVLGVNDGILSTSSLVVAAFFGTVA
jgi:Natural resistance-associated macrophage protein